MWQTIDIPDSVFNIGIHLKEGNWDSIEKIIMCLTVNWDSI